MSDKKNTNKQNGSKFKFNMYWVYGSIFLVFIAITFLNDNALSSRKITTNKFFEVLRSNDIDKIIVLNRSVAEVYIKREAQSKEEYQKLTNSPFFRPGNPIFEYNIGDLSNFEDKPRPTPTGIEFPTIAVLPIKFTLKSIRCIDPP